MGIDNNFLQNQEKFIFPPAERLEGAKKQLWEKARRILSGLGFDFSSHYGSKKGEEIVERIVEIEQMTKGEDYDVDENLFIETDIDYQGRPAIFKMVAQADPGYEPLYKIDYAVEGPDFQKEAERRLLREALMGEKLHKFGGEAVTADTIGQSETTPGKDMYFVKKVEDTEKPTDDFGYDEGKQLAATLFSLQYKVKSSALVNEVMAERKYKNQYELENEFSEDIFNDFDGYMDNSRAILNDRIADKAITKKQAKAVMAEMEKYREIITSTQMEDNEYSLVFNNTYLDNLKVDASGNIRLSDWSNVGTTQNRELSLVNDIGQALESARENLEKADEFERGLGEGLKEYYSDLDGFDSSRAEEMVKAIMRLAKLRTFQEI
jgi:hypothetical protein